MKKILSNGFSITVVVLSITLLGLVAGVGWYIWDNNITTEEPPTASQTEVAEPIQPFAEFLENEIEQIESVVGPDCTNEMRALNQRDWVIASEDFEYHEEDGVSDYSESNLVSSDYQYANVTFGCGSQGSTYVVMKQNDEWIIIAQSATVWSMCEDLDGMNVPDEIMPRCYDENNALIDTKSI